MNKNLIILGVGRVLQILVLFFSYRVMTKYLPKDEVGFYFLLMSISSYFGLVLMNPIGVYITRKLHQWLKEGQCLAHFLIFNVLVILITFLVYPAVYLASFFIGLQGLGWLKISVIMQFFIYFTTVNNTLIPSLNMLNFRGAFVSLTFFTQLFSLLLSFYFIYSFNTSAIYWILGQGLSLCIWFFVASLFFYSKVGKLEKIDLAHLKKCLTPEVKESFIRFTIPIAITNVSLWILNQSYRPLLEKYVGLEFLGYIGLGFGLATSLSVAFEYLIQQFYFPSYYEKISASSKELRELAWNSMANKVLPLYVVLAIFIGSQAKFLMRVLADEKFWGAYIFISVGVVIEFLRMVNNIFTLAAHSEMKNKITLIPYISGGVATFALVFIGVKQSYYEWTTPMGIILGSLIVLLLMFRSVKKIFSIKIDITGLFFTTLISLPMFLVHTVSTQFSPLVESIVILAVSGIYFGIIAIYLFKKNEQV